MSTLEQWAPSLLVAFNVFVGALFLNSRLTAFRRHLDERFDDLMNSLH